MPQIPAVDRVPGFPAARMHLAKPEVARCYQTLPGAANLPGSTVARLGRVPFPCRAVRRSTPGRLAKDRSGGSALIDSAGRSRGTSARREPWCPVPPLLWAGISFSSGFRRGFDPPAGAPWDPLPGGVVFGSGRGRGVVQPRGLNLRSGGACAVPDPVLCFLFPGAAHNYYRLPHRVNQIKLTKDLS